MQLTRHAEQRLQDRCLPRDVVATIYAYGSFRHARGAVSLMLDREAIDLAAEGDRRRRNRLERYCGAYVIVGDGETIITAARRTRRFRQ
ncbi:hypothetical protein SAMN05216257_1169 [Meinhardsimonia xiamenensis]|jgi:hypothetical protein|uniref:DUF4258 domain-containing protein n=1 Tax=Meinhardsimonia xiamenensis TaxID=990712 RepID=A0A1G9HK19_9RHOB|nr:hypothetical protein [Meinhardsimonia xiamenensis]PRX27136.1 hypothetical protein LV81_03063 [Meinhardsimonia xiamenensis]SDL13307.1 hypothetical protein SAMN05216257_1169 [Meinhardsimonia xiamenensis]